MIKSPSAPQQLGGVLDPRVRHDHRADHRAATCQNTCTLYSIPDAAFTTTASGNISLASTAVVNKVLIMVWDETKWNPSY